MLKVSQKGLVLSVCAIFFFASSVFGVTTIWDDGGSDNLWTTANNWNTNNVPTGSDHTYIGTPNTCVIDSNAYCYNLYVKAGGSLDIQSGGYLYTQYGQTAGCTYIGNTSGSQATLLVSGGSYYGPATNNPTIRIGTVSGSNGLLKLTGSSSSFSTNTMKIGYVAGSTAKVELYGGTLEIRSTATTSLQIENGGELDIKPGGKLILTGDKITRIKDFIEAGDIYTSQSGAGLVVDYNSSSGKTELSALVADANTIVLGSDASLELYNCALDFADCLERMTGQSYTVAIGGDGSKGFALGEAGDFPSLNLGSELPISRETNDKYIMRSHANGIYLVGSTETAAQHAAWDYLYRLGYRQFFPAEQWEYVPSVNDATVDINETMLPDFQYRDIIYSVGGWTDEMADNYESWSAKNRVQSGYDFWISHAWGQIISDNQSNFDSHPEYYALVGGSRATSGNKLCVSNSGLKNLVRDWAIDYLYDNPNADTVSLTPADGSGFCECSNCAQIGSVSDQVVSLINYVAGAIAQDANLSDKYVCSYSYSFYSPPPTIDVCDNVLIQSTRWYVKEGYTYEELLDGWFEKNAKVGVREYYSVTWTGAIPFSDAAMAANFEYIATSIPTYYNYGGYGSFIAEAGDDWGPCGLGYYMASRLLWDVNESAEGIKSDFFDKMFDDPNSSTVRSKMVEFYELMDGYNQPLLSVDLVGRMYRILDGAKDAVTISAIEDRIDALVVYTRYIELFRKYYSEFTSSTLRQDAFEDMIQHAYRMGDYMLINSKALYRFLENYDSMVSIPAGSKWDDPEPAGGWKDSSDFTSTEIANFISNGISNHSLSDVNVVEYSIDLVSTVKLNLNDVSNGDNGIYERANTERDDYWTYYTWLDSAGSIGLSVDAGKVYSDEGNTRFSFYDQSDPFTLVDYEESSPGGSTDTISLSSTSSGLHRIDIDDFYAGTDISWTDGTPITIESSRYMPTHFAGRWDMYFYVPKFTTEIRGYASREADFYDGAYTLRLSLTDSTSDPGYFTISVPAGQDGKLWKIEDALGEVRLLNVPPYLARNEDEILLPREIVMYNETFADITVGTAGSWVDVDLSSYGVLANQVVEIAMRNSSDPSSRYAGVRTKGSSLDRKVKLHVPSSDGWDMTTMTVKTDANKKIQVYAENISDVHFYLVGIWGTGDYVERFDALSFATTGAWTDLDLSSYSVGSGEVVEIMLSNTGTANCIGGVRGKDTSPSLDRRLNLHSSVSGAEDCIVMLAKADANKKISVYKYNTNIKHRLLGYWSEAPGEYTEKFVDVGKPGYSATWSDADLSSFGVPAFANCEMLISNESTSNSNIVGVRQVGSTLNRLFDLHKSSSSSKVEGGVMHVRSDENSAIQQYLENSSDDVEYYLLGYWK